MRRTALMALVLLAGACSSSGESTADSTAASTAVTLAPVDSTPPATAVEVDGCEVAPDPADYPEGETPNAVRPCDVPTALVTHTIREGSGRNAQDGDTLIVDFVGIRSEDGRIFDQSYVRGVPNQFVIGRGSEIQGWDDGLIGTQAGDVVKVDVPAELGFGPNPPAGGDVLQPNDALSFVVEVRAVIAPVTSDDAPLDVELEPSLGVEAVTTTVLRAGDGAELRAGQTAVVHLLLVRGDNQVVLFNTYDDSDPLQLILAEGGTLPGILEALPGTPIGSLIAVAMPPEQAFGAEGNTQLGLPAGIDLIAVVEVVGAY